MIKSTNYITIQGWMASDLKLSGNELLCFAIIYGFCQDGESLYQGGSRYLCEWLNISKHSVLDILKKLTEKKALEKIEKTINNVKFCHYRVVKKVHWGGEESSPGGGEESSPYNKNIYNTIDKKEIYKESFEEFWKEYPKQRAGSKQKAYTSYCRVIKEKRSTEDKLLESVKDYACSDEVARGYAKGCAAWLNDDRFNTIYGNKFSIEW